MLNRIAAAYITIDDHQSDGLGLCYCTECEIASKVIASATPQELKQAGRDADPTNRAIEKAKSLYDQVMAET